MMLEVEHFLASEDVAAKKIVCFHLSSRYSSSKKATRKASTVLLLHEKRDKFPAVARAAPPLGIDASASVNIDAYESQKSAIKEIIDALEEENVHTVGICGIGGVGKTTLVTELGKRVKGKLFDEVAMAVVSQNVDIKKMQQDIATMLGMEKLPDDDEPRREVLWGRICRGNKVMVILDDVWSRLDLKKLGIPVGKHNNSDCKVVLTSRNETECRYMGAQRVISLTPLPEKEAWALFKHEVVGEDVGTNLDINEIEGKIFRECGGLPIAIMAVGVALRNESKHDWELVYQNLKAVSPTDNSVLREVYPVLATSYTYLKDEEAKSCFMLCSLFKEDEEIPVELLAQYGMGSNIFKRGDSSLRDARRGARNAVNTLKHSHLLLPGKDHDHVRMHDVVRDVALAIASQDKNNMFLVNAGKGLTMLPDIDSFKMYVGISLMQNDISRLSVGLECSKLQILLLRGNGPLQIIPDDFFQEMKMLHVVDLGRCRITSLPRSISFCMTVRTLLLDYSNVRDISVLEGLSELEILSLSSSDIDRVPEQIGRLTNLRLLDIRNCRNLSHIAPGVISSLHKLEDLYVGRSFMKWEIKKGGNQTMNASLTELNSLQRLTNLDIAMLSPKVVPQNLQFNSLHKFVISIGKDKTFSSISDKYPYCSILTLNGMNIAKWGWLKKLMKDVDCLILDSLRNLRNIIIDLNDVNFNKLRHFGLSNCDSVSCLADMVDLESALVFCNLEELHLFGLDKFSQIIDSQLHPTNGLFIKLHEISISRCPEMSTALEFNLLSGLQNLRSLRVKHCASLEYIIGDGVESYKQGETKFLPMLKRLQLRDLPKLVDICDGHTDQFVSLGNLESLEIWDCKKLRRVFSAAMVKDLVCLNTIRIIDCESLERVFEPLEVEHMGRESRYGAPLLQNLKYVDVQWCENLSYIFSPSIAKRLSRLSSLLVWLCIKIEAIIGPDETEAASASAAAPTTTEKMVMFPSLSKISLRRLGGLKHSAWSVVT